MSIGVLGDADLSDLSATESAQAAAAAPRLTRQWNPRDFAARQIHGLVREVFFYNHQKPVKQVILSAVDYETNIGPICDQVAEGLAQETQGSVALVGSAGDFQGSISHDSEQWKRNDLKPLQKISTRLGENLWFVPAGLTESLKTTTSGLHAYLAELRREFEFSIVEGPPVGRSNDTMAMAQFADGIILVLSAKHTRRVTAQRMRKALERSQARILGTVLADRMFPMPERLYRRL